MQIILTVLVELIVIGAIIHVLKHIIKNPSKVALWRAEKRYDEIPVPGKLFIRNIKLYSIGGIVFLVFTAFMCLMQSLRLF